MSWFVYLCEWPARIAEGWREYKVSGASDRRLCCKLCSVTLSAWSGSERRRRKWTVADFDCPQKFVLFQYWLLWLRLLVLIGNNYESRSMVDTSCWLMHNAHLHFPSIKREREREREREMTKWMTWRGDACLNGCSTLIPVHSDY